MVQIVSVMHSVLLLCSLFFFSPNVYSDYNNKSECVDLIGTVLEKIECRLAEISYTYHHEFPDAVRQELLEIKENLDEKNKVNKNSPLFWYYQGLWLEASRRVESSVLAETKYKENLVARNNDPIIKDLVERSNAAYIRAFDLDQTNEPHLTPSMYSKHLSWLPLKYKIIGHQKAIEAGGLGENESDIWFQYWGLIARLGEAGRFDEAQEALDQMYTALKKEGYVENDEDDTYTLAERAKQDLEKAREKYYQEHPEEHGKSESKTANTELGSTISNGQTQTPVQSDELIKRDTANNKSDVRNNIIILVFVVIGLFIIAYLFYRRKNN